MKPESNKESKIFYGWWVVLFAAIQGMFGNGVISNGFSRFFEPIRNDLSISYAQMSLVFSLQRAEGSVAGPLVGWLVDNYGARPMILFLRKKVKFPNTMFLQELTTLFQTNKSIWKRTRCLCTIGFRS